jgi:steroid delta-isomerase-like uncharacterized protein
MWLQIVAAKWWWCPWILADQVLSEDFVDHAHPHQAPGPESVKQEVITFREGFPNARITVEKMIAEADTVAFRLTLQGTHRGTFAGFPPTGKEVVLIGVNFIRIAAGKIEELWSVQDTLYWAEQLGLMISRWVVQITIDIWQNKEPMVGFEPATGRFTLPISLDLSSFFCLFSYAE